MLQANSELIMVHLIYLIIASPLHLLESERVKVDSRRIEDTFFQYAVLKLCHWYPCLAS